MFGINETIQHRYLPMICLIHSILSSSETHCTQEESYCCVSSFVNICFTLILCILDFCQYPTYGHNLVLCFNWYTSSFRVYRLQFLYMENMYKFLRGYTIFHFSHLKYFSCTIQNRYSISLLITIFWSNTDLMLLSDILPQYRIRYIFVIWKWIANDLVG